MKVEVKELKISNELEKKIDMICKFADVRSNLTRIFNKDLDNAKWELNRKYRLLIGKIESKTKGVLNKKIVFDYDTYLELMDYLKQANDAVNRVAKSEGLYKELEKEIKYYKAFLAVNDKKDNEIKYLKGVNLHPDFNIRVVRKLKICYNLRAKHEIRKLESSLYGVT